MADTTEYLDVAACDALRKPEQVTLADSRSQGVALAERYEDIRRFELNPAVPHSIRVHFETAKNLYLYSWFVYRFFPVAEQQALASLEFALRERLPSPENTKNGKSRREGLSVRLKRAHELGLIRNEGLKIRERMAVMRARERYRFEILEEMIRTGKTAMILYESNIVPSEQDFSHDWLGAFIEALPKLRNEYAHGSHALHPTVLGRFEIVCDLINQLYPNES